MLELDLANRTKSLSVTAGEMPCLMLGSASGSGGSPCLIPDLIDPDELGDWRWTKEGPMVGGLLTPLGWREWMHADIEAPAVVATDDWEEDDDVVDDDDDDEDEEEEEDDDFFPDDADDFEDEEDEEDDDDDDDDDEDEDE